NLVTRWNTFVRSLPCMPEDWSSRTPRLFSAPAGCAVWAATGAVTGVASGAGVSALAGWSVFVCETFVNALPADTGVLAAWAGAAVASTGGHGLGFPARSSVVFASVIDFSSFWFSVFAAALATK